MTSLQFLPAAGNLAAFPSLPAPTITSFTPTSGPVGTVVVITGTHFTGATLVSVNSGAVQSFVVNSATQITATLSNAQASGLVRVTTPGGTAVSSTNFTVAGAALPLPDVSRFLFAGLASEPTNTAASWKDLSGHGNDLTGGGIALSLDKEYRPVYREDWGDTQNTGFSSPWSDSGANGTSIYALLDIFDTQDYQPSPQYLMFNSSLILGVNADDTGAYKDRGANVAQGSIVAQGRGQLLLWVLNPLANTGEVFLNGTSIFQGTYSACPMPAGTYWGHVPGGGTYGLRCAWHALFVRAGVETPQQRADMTAYLQSYYQQVPAAPARNGRKGKAVLIGDSRQEGYGTDGIVNSPGPFPNAPAGLMNNYLGADLTFVNKGKGGDYMQLIQNRLYDIAAEYDPINFYVNATVLAEGLNDEAQNSSSIPISETIARRISLLRSLEARSFWTFDATYGPATYSTHPRYEDLNAAIRASAAQSWVESIIELALQPELQNPADSTYFFDPAHYKIPGSGVMARTFYRTLRPFFISQGVPVAVYAPWE